MTLHFIRSVIRLSFILFTGVLMAACSAYSEKQSKDTSIPEPLTNTVREWAPAGTPRGVILGLHSFGDFGAAFEQVGPWFAETGYLFVAYDQAGFGDRLQQGRWAGEQELIDDAATQIRRLHQTHPQPLFVLGESLGGAVAILAAQQQPDKVAGLILAGPAVREGIRFRYGWNAAIATAATLAPGYRLTVERNADDPSLSPTSAQRLAKEPRVMREVRMDAYWGLIKLADSASDSANHLNIPTLLLYGGNDHSVPEAGIVNLRQHLSANDQGKYRFYPQAPHLLLQSWEWQRICKDIAQWLTWSQAPQKNTQNGLTGSTPPCEAC
ncbi:alpha/beta fold hydrolase [Alcanivorax sp.]|jgi:alpha-beta hydrolase superfamily lysophospholipase|uniref:alpha/beta fold hydrolase n=1 Tax=Alcanivorax sp. TaxID=1872427 RepID=UPI0032D9907B